MSDRNLNPHAEARVAMALWSERYSKQKLGCMDFYDGLTAAQKQTCAQIVDGIICADRADGRTPSPTHISVAALRLAREWLLSVEAHIYDSEKFKSDLATIDAVLAGEPTPTELSVGSRWRVFEDTTPGYWGIELEQASNDDDAIMYPIKIHRERVAIVVDAHNAEVARLESLHRSEISDMAERFRSVNVSEAVKQLADILPAAPAEPSVGATLETDPLKLQGYCQQLLDIIQNYEVDLEGEDNDLIAHISKAFDPAHPVTSEEQP